MNSFVDELVISVSSGHGGPGAVSFRREKYAPKGGPDGGDGGRGGDVYFNVRENLKTLTHLHFNKHYKAQNGQHGRGADKQGPDGEDLIIEVPPGTLVSDAESGEKLLDLLHPGPVLFLSGGIGGKGNAQFATARKQAPRHAQDGLPGSTRRIKVELNLIADIGFVGLPNAGKSTLLSVLTAATPKIGNYPFTTRIPNLGVLRSHGRDLILADIPGIIEGASQGAGLGLRFLKHISRTKAIVFVLDAASEELKPETAFRILRKELETYGIDSSKRTALIVLNKIDIPEAADLASQSKVVLKREGRVFSISAASRQGIDTLIQELFLVDSRGPEGASEEDSEFAVPEWMRASMNAEQDALAAANAVGKADRVEKAGAEAGKPGEAAGTDIGNKDQSKKTKEMLDKISKDKQW